MLSEQEKEELKAEVDRQPKIFVWVRSDTAKRKRKVYGERWMDITFGSSENDPLKWTSIALRRSVETGKVELLVDHKKIKEID